MHNLAIALSRKGYVVTGSDDEFFEPSKSRLKAEGLLPADPGWHPSRITPSLDAVILGMHARGDNPELMKAKELNVPVYSFPEYLYEQSRNKLRVVIGGSHGKTTITAMVMHVLKYYNKEFDFMVGAQLEGFDIMVRLSDTADIMIMEGDEYLSSALDPRPKFHIYRPHIALISGIAWDHINVFPTIEKYIEQFGIFARLIPPGGTLIYNREDAELRRIAGGLGDAVEKEDYGVHEHRVSGGRTVLLTGEGEKEVLIFGRHNMMNLEGARRVCARLGISDPDFYQAITTFRGASRRLEKIGESGQTVIFKDFAHSPSKLAATVAAVKEQYPGRKLVACMELHTYSSLNSDFLEHYRHTMEPADKALVYFNPHALAVKKLPPVDKSQIWKAFDHPDLEVFDDSEKMKEKLSEIDWHGRNLLMMSSGDFNGIDLHEFAAGVLD